MTKEEMKEKLENIHKSCSLFDLCAGEKLSDKQINIVQDIFDLFRSINWMLNFSEYKEIKYDKKPAIITEKGRHGVPVKVRSCKKEHGDKTYFGIYIGDVAQTVSHSIEDNVVTAGFSFHNPAIFIPELGEIVYGFESWWCRIQTKEDLDKLITDDTINNVWYIQALKTLAQSDTKDETCQQQK